MVCGPARGPRRASPACNCRAPQQRGRGGRVDVEALRREHLGGRPVDVAEEHPGDAALEQRDAAAGAPAAGRSGSAHAPGARPAQARARPAGATAPAAARQPQGAGRRARRAAGRAPAAAGVGEQREGGAARRRSRASACRALDLGRVVLDELVVADARRAGGHAGHAAEAAVEVRDHRAESSAVFSCAAFMSTMRPRGESISSPQTRRSGTSGGRTHNGRSLDPDQRTRSPRRRGRERRRRPGRTAP